MDWRVYWRNCTYIRFAVLGTLINCIWNFFSRFFFVYLFLFLHTCICWDSLHGHGSFQSIVELAKWLFSFLLLSLSLLTLHSYFTCERGRRACRDLFGILKAGLCYAICYLFKKLKKSHKLNFKNNGPVLLFITMDI